MIRFIKETKNVGLAVPMQPSEYNRRFPTESEITTESNGFAIYTPPQQKNQKNNVLWVGEAADDKYYPYRFMNWADAYRWMILGHRVSRYGWATSSLEVLHMQGSNHFATIQGFGFGEYVGEPTFDNLLLRVSGGNKLMPWVPTSVDVLGCDWYLTGFNEEKASNPFGDIVSPLPCGISSHISGTIAPMNYSEYSSMNHEPVIDFQDNVPGYDLYYRENNMHKWISGSNLKSDYSKIVGMTIGDAMDALRVGKAVGRLGWNGTDHLLCIDAGKNTVSGYELSTKLSHVKFSDAVFMHTSDNFLQPWNPSNDDVFARDWYIPTFA